VNCTFEAPDDGTYSVTIADGLGVSSATFTFSDGGSPECD
jgi:hypothetical protein